MIRVTRTVSIQERQVRIPSYLWFLSTAAAQYTHTVTRYLPGDSNADNFISYLYCGTDAVQDTTKRKWGGQLFPVGFQRPRNDRVALVKPNNDLTLFVGSSNTLYTSAGSLLSTNRSILTHIIF